MQCGRLLGFLLSGAERILKDNWPERLSESDKPDDPSAIPKSPGRRRDPIPELLYGLGAVVLVCTLLLVYISHTHIISFEE